MTLHPPVVNDLNTEDTSADSVVESGRYVCGEPEINDFFDFIDRALGDDDTHLLEKKLVDFLFSPHYTFFYRNHTGEVLITKRSLQDVHSGAQISCKTVTGKIYQFPKLSYLIEKLRLKKNSNEFQNIRSIDREKLEEDRKMYGAKGAHLLQLTRSLSDPALVNFQQITSRINVPPFLLISCATYDRWIEGQDVTDELLSYYLSFSNETGLYVRSSAANSEDGDIVTGAGIYHSQMIPPFAPFEIFRDAVFSVYRSCNTPEAQDYRAQYGITHETMGIVLQVAVTGEVGHVNSSRPPEGKLCTLYYGDLGFPVHYEVDKLLRGTFINSASYPLATESVLIQPDSFSVLKLTHTGATIGALQASQLLQQAYGIPVQVEFVRSENTAHIVQVRPLPQMNGVQKVEFPDQAPLMEFYSAEISCDKVFDVLRCDEDNREREGVVIFDSSFFGSNAVNQSAIVRAFPKQGVLILMHPSRVNAGHIEMLAVSRKIPLLVPKRESNDVHVIQNATKGNIEENNYGDGTSKISFGEGMFGYDSFFGHTRLRIVSDGTIGRVYTVD